MKFHKIFSIALLSLATATAAQAADIATTVDLGTTGIGLHLTAPVVPKLNARLGLNYATYSYDGHTSSVNYDFKLKLATVDALLDYHPFDGGFRFSAGLVHNGNSIDARSRPDANGNYTINGRSYDAAVAGNLIGKVEFRKNAPYLGIGWGNAVKATGWSFGMDLGVAFQGAPKTSLALRGCTAPALICSRLADDAAGENARLAKEVKDFKLYPVLRAGISYRF